MKSDLNMRNFDPSLYFVCDPSLCNGRAVHSVLEAALQGGVTLVQLRCKFCEKEARELAPSLHTLCKAYNTPFLINDYVQLAADIGADGVHIGQTDMKPQEARQQIGPNKILGLTAFTQEQIKAIDPSVVDYIGTGPVFRTQTDKGKPVLGPDEFSTLKAHSTVPVIGIGGITINNAASVIEAGADGVAMMRAISEAEDPQDAAHALKHKIEEARLKKAA